MNPMVIWLATASVVLSVFTTQAQDAANPPKVAIQSTEPTPEELEAKFRDTLHNVTFKGRWSSIRDGQLGPGRDEEYSIVEVSKLGGETWIIRARIKYGDREFVAPLPVQVKWAGDTAVITVDALAMPGSTNAYSARVLIYDEAYAGRWSGSGYGGLLNGVITKNESSTEQKE